jgi:ferredoxin-NADP reductase
MSQETLQDTLQVIVRRREVQGGAVVVLDLHSADGRPLPAFEAGAHIDLHLADGLVRQYSLCGDPADASRYRLGVLRDPASRGGSAAVFDRLQEGSTLTIGVPRNHFPLAADAQHSVLIGGGIGITPMISMAHALTAAGTHLYTCGPSGFMDWVIATGEKAGLPSAHIHREYFNADIDTSGAGFEVEARASGKTVRVLEGQSIVAALKSIGIEVEVSCEEGVCGTCVCTVLEGDCDHRDVYLTDEEKADNDQIMTCCSRAKSARLVLDI